MITASKDRNAHLPTSWAAGICMAVLGVGLYGASFPLQPPQVMTVAFDTGDNVPLEEFEPPPAGPTEPEQKQEEVIEEVEIPPLPELQAPLTPPEMTEITPVEEVQKPTPPTVKPPDPKPPKPKPVVQRSTGAPSQQEGAGSGSRNGAGKPTLFTGGGGRFPHPSYPLAARSAHQQGVVRLLVTVEASGLPSSVSVSSSSGYATLDQAARDHVSRRWRWPSGDVRLYIVPMRFQLQ